MRLLILLLMVVLGWSHTIPSVSAMLCTVVRLTWQVSLGESEMIGAEFLVLDNSDDVPPRRGLGIFCRHDENEANSLMHCRAFL